MTLAGFDLPGRRFIVAGKGSRDRMGAFGHWTSQAIRRYLRRRKESRFAASPALWLGRRGPLSADAINELVRRRADRAGLGRVHSHSLRHTFASDFRAKGGSDSDLLTAGGWRSPAMLQRYGRSAAMERALAAAERLALADDL